MTDIIKDYPNLSVKERASRAQKLIAPLEKATNELKAYSPSLSLQTAEQQEVALALKEAVTNSMIYRLEELKILSSDSELTKEDLDNLLLNDNKSVDYLKEASKQGEKMDAIAKQII